MNSYKFPNHWLQILLKDCIFFQEGPGLRKWQFGPEGIPFLNIRTFNNGLIDKSKCRFVKKDEFKGKYEHFLLKAGDIVVSSSGTIGKVAIIRESDLPVMLNTSVIRFRTLFPDCLYQNYLKHYLQSPHFFNQINTLKTGSAIYNFGPSHLNQVKITIPPRIEQRRIAAKLEKLLTKVDKCKERLGKIPTTLTRFRRSVLSAACSGELTKDWREKNPEVEAAAILLLKIKTPYPLNHLNIFKETSDHALPLTWEWVPLGKIGKLLGGGTPSKSNLQFWNGSIPWISPKNMKQDRIKDSTDHISEKALKNSSAKLIPSGSILFVVRGMILNHTLPVAITDETIAINQDMKALVPELVEMGEFLLISAKYISNKILFAVKEATHGTRRIESAVLKNWAVPIPPLAEQHEIVRRIDALFKIADQIEIRYQKAKTHVEKLTQSTLAKAFRGELVPQDPVDPPALELLRQINVEREKQQAELKPKKYPKRKTKRESKKKA